LLEDSALIDHGIDPASAQLAYVGGFSDPTLAQIGTTLHRMLGREADAQPTDRIFAEGLRTALAAHLIGNYTVDRWQPATRSPALEPKRLQRVLDFIDTRLASDICLDDLAGEACLSPFHFSRLFHEATGLSPHRYLIERRIRTAQKMLASEHASIAEIALDTGFGSQANFSRTFRKITGVTPRQYREQTAR
jgi:AraC family transcriptional regulator